jgi:hypothetical protein
MNVYIFQVAKRDGKTSLEDLRIHQDNIKNNFRETEWGGVDWVHLAGYCVHGNETSGSIKYRDFLDELRN